MSSSACSFSGVPYTSQEKVLSRILRPWRASSSSCSSGKNPWVCMIAGENGKAAASGNRLSLRYPSVPARKHDGCDSKFNSIHARRRQVLHQNDSFLQQEGGKSQEDDPSFPAPAAGEEINGGRLSSLPEEREGRAASSQPLCPWSCGTFSASPDRPDGPLRGGLPFPRSGCTCKVEGCGQQSPPLPEIEDAIFWHGSSSQISP